MTRRRPSIWAWAAAGVPTLFLGYFFLYPLATILWRGLGGTGMDAFRTVLGNENLRGVAWFTLWQAVVSTVITLLVAFPAAYVFARFEFPGRRLLRAAFTVPFVMPTVVVGSAFLALLGPSGPLGVDLRRTVWAVLIAHVFYNFAVVVRTVGSLWERIDPQLEEAARVLGATRWRAFRETTLPLLVPGIASAASLVFLFTFTSFGVVLILGDLSYRTLEVEIWRQTFSSLDLGVAATLAVLQLVGVTAILLGYSTFQRRRSRELRLLPRTAIARRPETRSQRLSVWGVMAVSGVLVALPLAVMAERSFRTADGYGLGNYRTLFTAGRISSIPPLEAVGNSLRFAVAAAVIAVVVGLLAAGVIVRRRARLAQTFDALLMLPLGTSAVTLGLGFLIALDRPVDLRASAWLVVIAHALVATPLVVRLAVPALRSIQERLREAAAVLGADRRRVWREVDLPIIAGATATGAGLAAAVSLGEFGATAFVARPDDPTLPIAIFRLLGQPGRSTFGEAMALATILMVVVTVVILAIDRFRVGAQEF